MTFTVWSDGRVALAVGGGLELLAWLDTDRVRAAWMIHGRLLGWVDAGSA